MSELIVRTDGRSATVEPGRTFRIGRDESADLSIAHRDVSRYHAVFYYADGWCVADEGSTNGTYADGEKIQAIRIERPMSLRLGGADSPVAVDVHLGGPRVAVARPDVVEGFLHGETVMAAPTPQPFRDQHTPTALPAGVAALTIGKASDNDLVVDDIHVSRHHARAVAAQGGFLVEDLNSLNGTFLNGAPIQRAFMTDADRLTIGNTDFVRVGGQLVALREARVDSGGLSVSGLTFALRTGKKLIDGVDLRAARGTLTAVIGPSGAGKSTLSRLLSGVTDPTSGEVSFDGFDLQRDYQAVKTRVGLVPQDDVVHRQLTLQRALRYAANLRLPGRLPKDAKRSQVAKAIGQLGLDKHGSTRIERLSGGQRKRASVAMELLTEPSLLILDEPTSGLDPALDRQVMRTLRELADGDRTVFVITHSVAYLDLCDQVLVLAPGGMTAYLGPPSGIVSHFGTDDWGDIFGGLADDPAGAHRRWAAASGSSSSKERSQPGGGAHTIAHGSSWIRQFMTLIARQINLMVADRGYIAFLLALPFVIGLMPVVVPGSAGLTAVPAGKIDEAGEPTSVLSLLIIGATFMGISMSIRDLVGERAIYLREKAVGLYPSAYLLAKLAVFGVFSVLSAGIMTWVASLVKSPPATGVMGWGSPLFELFLPLALTTWVGAALGLLISALVTSNDQVMPVLIVVLMVQLVLHGGLIPVLGNDALNAASTAVPGRWGFAAGASGIDLQALLDPGRPPGSGEAERDPLWEPTRTRWVLNMLVLSGFGAGFSVLAWLRLRHGRR